MDKKDLYLSNEEIAKLCDKNLLINKDWTSLLLPWYQAIAQAASNHTLKELIKEIETHKRMDSYIYIPKSDWEALKKEIE